VSQTLLRKIREAATEGSAENLSSLLRMCMVLAYGLGNDTLKTWVDAELNGYKDRAALPDYRVFPVHSYSTVTDTIGRTERLRIPKSAIIAALGQEIAEDYCHIYMMQNIAEINALIAASDGTVGVPWPHEAVVRLKPFLNCEPLTAEKEFRIEKLKGILDIVQSRVLKMTLELEKEDPSLGEGGPTDIPKAKEERIEHIMHSTVYHFYGDNNIISAPVSHAQTKVVAGDLDSLRVALQQLGLSPQEVEETALAVRDEKTHQRAIAKLRGLWDKLTGNKVVGKAAETGAVELVKHAIKDYFGA